MDLRIWFRLSEMERPDNRSYKLRGARATPAQEAAYAALWEKYGINPSGVLNLTSYFPETVLAPLEPQVQGPWEHSRHLKLPTQNHH